MRALRSSRRLQGYRTHSRDRRAGDRINFHLYTPLGEFFSSPMVITQDLLEEREVCWHMLCWDYSLAPGSWVRLKYVVQIQNNDLYDSPLREYAVVT